MAVPLYCPNCHENLGKDVENPNPAYCSNCGTGKIPNPRGYTDEEEKESLCQKIFNQHGVLFPETETDKLLHSFYTAFGDHCRQLLADGATPVEILALEAMACANITGAAAECRLRYGFEKRRAKMEKTNEQ